MNSSSRYVAALEALPKAEILAFPNPAISMIKPCAGDLKAAGNFEVGKKISKHSIVAKLALSLDHCSLHIPVGRVGTGVGPLATRMSALGQKQTLRDVRTMSALPPKADMDQHGPDVC